MRTRDTFYRCLASGGREDANHVDNMADEEYERPRKVPKTLKEKDSGKRLIVVLEKASLETVKVGDGLAFKVLVKLVKP